MNLPATDVRASAKFYAEIIGMTEAAWTFPPPERIGHISADPAGRVANLVEIPWLRSPGM